MKKSRAVRGCLIGLVLLLGLGGYLFWRARTPPQVGRSVPFAKLSPEEKARRRQDVQKLKAQLDDIGASARRHEHKKFTLNVSEDELNTVLQDTIRTEKFMVRDLRAGLEPGQLALQGHAYHNDFDAIITLKGSIRAEDGKLVFKADSLQVGGLPAPSKFKDKAERAISEKLNDLLGKAPVHVESVEIKDQQLAIAGTTD